MSVSSEGQTFSCTVRLQLVRNNNNIGSDSCCSITLQHPDTTCYDVYSVRLITITGSPLTYYGPLFPVLVDPTMQILELKRLSNLQRNQIFMAEVTAINIDGKRMSSESTLFSKKLAYASRY